MLVSNWSSQVKPKSCKNKSERTKCNCCKECKSSFRHGRSCNWEQVCDQFSCNSRGAQISFAQIAVWRKSMWSNHLQVWTLDNMFLRVSNSRRRGKVCDLSNCNGCKYICRGRKSSCTAGGASMWSSHLQGLQICLFSGSNSCRSGKYVFQGAEKQLQGAQASMWLIQGGAGQEGESQRGMGGHLRRILMEMMMLLMEMIMLMMVKTFQGGFFKLSKVAVWKQKQAKKTQDANRYTAKDHKLHFDAIPQKSWCWNFQNAKTY